MSCHKTCHSWLFIITALCLTSLPVAATELQANDLANKLRMLSQQILISYSQLEQGVEYVDAREDLTAHIGQYQEYLDTLNSGAGSEESQQLLGEIAEVWQAFRKTAQQKVSAEKSKTLFGQGEQLQQMAFELFEVYEEEAGEEHGPVMDVVGKLDFLAYRLSMLYTYKVRGFNTDDALLATTITELDKSIEWLRQRPENTDYINGQLEDTKQTMALLQRSISISNTDLSFTVGRTTKRIADTVDKLSAFYIEQHQKTLSAK